jgi:hypothetical protein
MRLDLQTPCITRAELVRLSEFRLPVAALTKYVPEGTKPPRGRKAREALRHVPGLSYEQVRASERRGLFDPFVVVPAGAGRPLAEWIRWTPRARGDVRLYSLLDVAVARLLAWLLCDGFTAYEARRIIRDDAGGLVRVTMGAETADGVYIWRIHGHPANGWCDRANQPFAPMDPEIGSQWFYPLAWLGIKGDALPRIRKYLRQSPDVWARSWEPRTELAAQQQHKLEDAV